MMKFLMYMLFMIPLCFQLKIYWLVQMMMFLLFFLFMNITLNIYNFSNMSYMMGLDLLSFGLIMLSIWICCLMIMSSENLYKNNLYITYFLLNVVFLMILLYLTFSIMNLFLFYLFFEGSLIPTLLLIIGWGYQPERIQAGMYLLFYTLFMSLPLLMSIFYLNNKINSLMIYMLKFYDLNYFLLYLSMIMAFLVKMPMYFVHLWLPKAHVEAPISGSMILAGVMLKLGGYGMMRVMIILQKINMKFNYIWIIISLIGGVYISMKCFCQYDIKSLIAYSSVAHMSLVISGIMTMNYWGYLGSYILMIGHGLCSSGMFCLSNINYERIGSRSLFLNKGLMNFMPSMSLWWFLLSSSNMAAPPSMNLMGEMTLIISLISWSKFSMLMLMLISFFSAGYSLYLYSYTQHGKLNLSVMSFYMGVSREYLMLFLHWYPLNLLILKIDYFMLWF
uniref:NADH-ubiquinone oxidoreductase chain 4 n=1 Tax=Celastrina lavendularis TaxID=1453171 RepID=A0A9E9M847_9NEOP|nr:NADH dehydrogenase subunit 4 [Celastrina lavendularis]YP_010701146.1 NADH dehydrogenase subunit 4 [Celastrina oreas]WAW79870.1 NADH dehydrogenase subunit 4 [Celastrina lavendularis]WCI21387.1 NADH dehydrogenase subunit 4 [Celastrina oreas]